MAETEPGDHGNSVAAWTIVALIVFGSALIACGVAFGWHSLDIAGVLVCGAGVAAGKILTRAGFGAPALRAPGEQETGEASTRS